MFVQRLGNAKCEMHARSSQKSIAEAQCPHIAEAWAKASCIVAGISPALFAILVLL